MDLFWYLFFLKKNSRRFAKVSIFQIMQKMNRDVEDAEALAKKHTQEVQDPPVAFLQVQAKKSSDFEEPLTADILKRMSPAELEAFRKFQEHPIPVEEMIRNLTKNNFAELIPDG